MSKYVEGIHEERFDNFLADLRSGEYQQGRNTLENRGKFCCLGVACIRPAAEGVVERKATVYGEICYGVTSVDMPPEVVDYLGIPGANLINKGNYGTDIAFLKQGYNPNTFYGRSQTAVGFNDHQKKTFAEIADAFEQEFLKED